MKKSLKKVKLIILMTALIVTYFFCERLLGIKTEHGIRQASDMYVQPEDSIDVVFLGSSHIHTNVNTAQLWSEHGIAAYDYSGADQPLWMSYNYLKEICKYQKPKLVVLDLFSVAVYDTEYFKDFIFLSDNLNGFKFSLNKIEMMKNSCQFETLTDHFPSFVTWHNRYKELSEVDLKQLFATDYERMAFKGYTPYFGVEEKAEPQEVKEVTELEPKEAEYLQKIKDYCAENDMELMFVTAPHVEEADKAHEIYNRVEQMALDEGYLFLNGMKLFDELGIDCSKDFNDESHLNYWGSCKYTRYLGKLIKESYEIPDRRGQEGYESWDRHVEEIKRKVEQNA